MVTCIFHRGFISLKEINLPFMFNKVVHIIVKWFCVSFFCAQLIFNEIQGNIISSVQL